MGLYTNRLDLRRPIGTDRFRRVWDYNDNLRKIDVQLGPINKDWVEFDPGWHTTGTQPSIVNGTARGNYLRFGTTVFAKYDLEFDDQTTFGAGFWRLRVPEELPAIMLASGEGDIVQGGYLGTFHARVGSGSTIICGIIKQRSQYPYGRIIHLRSNNAAGVTNLVPVTWANGDALRGMIIYSTTPRYRW